MPTFDQWKYMPFPIFLWVIKSVTLVQLQAKYTKRVPWRFSLNTLKKGSINTSRLLNPFPCPRCMVEMGAAMDDFLGVEEPNFERIFFIKIIQVYCNHSAFFNLKNFILCQKASLQCMSVWRKNTTETPIDSQFTLSHFTRNQPQSRDIESTTTGNGRLVCLKHFDNNLLNLSKLVCGLARGG